MNLTLVKCKTASYFPKTPYGWIANAMYKKKIKGKTAPAVGVTRFYEWSDFLKQGRAYIARTATRNWPPIPRPPLPL